VLVRYLLTRGKRKREEKKKERLRERTFGGGREIDRQKGACLFDADREARYVPRGGTNGDSSGRKTSRRIKSAARAEPPLYKKGGVLERGMIVPFLLRLTADGKRALETLNDRRKLIGPRD